MVRICAAAFFIKKPDRIQAATIKASINVRAREGWHKTMRIGVPKWRNVADPDDSLP
jgi:hypothetical protein